MAEAARLDAKGGMEAVEHILKARQELLANERVTAGRTMEAALRPLREKGLAPGPEGRHGPKHLCEKS